MFNFHLVFFMYVYIRVLLILFFLTQIATNTKMIYIFLKITISIVIHAELYLEFLMIVMWVLMLH